MNDATVHPKPRKRGVRILVFAGAAIAATVLAFGAFGTRSLFPPAVLAIEKLVIAAPSVPHISLLHIADAKGYFAEVGLDVSIVPTLTGPEAVSFVAQGKADLGTASEVVVVLAIMKGEDLAIAASMLSANQTTVVARRDRGISKAADLAGKTIGVTVGTAGDYFLWAYLIRNKISPERISFVNLTPDRIAEALAKGTIDATATWQPWVFKAQSALGEGNAVSFAGDGAYAETHVVVGRSELFRNRPQAVAKLLRALLKAEQFSRARPEEALSLVADRLKVDVKSLQPVWKNFSFRVDLLQSHLITMEDEARWAMARGYVEKRPVPNFLPNLYLDALLAARAERVTVVR